VSNPVQDEGASMTSQVTDVLEAVQSFIAKGYDREYRVKDGNLVDLELGSTLDACSMRLESGDDGEDASNMGFESQWNENVR